jgi:hypothetical protein
MKPASHRAPRKGTPRPPRSQRTKPDGVALTPERLIAFVDTYRVTFSASKAALAAGYAPSNADKAGRLCLADARVQEVLHQRQLDTLASNEVKVADILRALMEVAYSDIGEVLEACGARARGDGYAMTLKAFQALPKAVRRTVASVKATTRNLVAGDGVNDQVVEFKLWNKMQALDLLARHKGLLAEAGGDAATRQRRVQQMSDEELLEEDRRTSEAFAQAVEARRKLMHVVKAVPALPPKKGDGER